MATNEEMLAQAINLKIEGNYDAAAPLLIEVLASEENHVEARRQLGLIYGFQGLFDESIEELAKAAQLDESRSDVLCDLAMTQAMLGMYEEAKANFEQVLRMDPGNKTANEQMVYFKDLAAL